MARLGDTRQNQTVDEILQSEPVVQRDRSSVRA
jgi:hypothetical protein